MRRPGATSPRWAVALAAAVGAEVALCVAVVRGGPILAARWRILLLISIWAVAWLVAGAAISRVRVRWLAGAIVVGAVALRVAAFAGPPTLSDDLYRYAWDAEVQGAGVDPYAYPPADEHLIALREPWLWPDERGCAAIERPPGCTRINRPTERTIYPPLAQAWFRAVHAPAPDARDKPWQVAGALIDLATCALIVVALRRWRRPWHLVGWYALCPVPIIELVNNAHVDGLAIALLVGALAVLGPPTTKRSAWRDVAFGVLVAAAALVKLYPAVALVAVLGGARRGRWRAAMRAVAAASLTAAVAYAPHVWSIGTEVLGYLPGYLREEHYDSGGRFLLLGMLGLGGTLTTALAILTLVAGLAWLVWRAPPAPLAACVAVVLVCLVATPVQPWYATTAVCLAVVAARPWGTVAGLAAYPYFFAVILDHPHAIAIGRASYAAGAVAVLLGLRRRRSTIVVHAPAAE